MKEVFLYSAAATFAFLVLNAGWIWLLTKAEASREQATSNEKLPATAIMGARFQFEPSVD